MREGTKKIRCEERLERWVTLNAQTKKDAQAPSIKVIMPSINEEHGKEDKRTIQKAARAPPKHCKKNNTQADAQADAQAGAQIVGHPCASRPLQLPLEDGSPSIDEVGGNRSSSVSKEGVNWLQRHDEQCGRG